MGPGVYFIHSAVLPSIYLSPCIYMSPALIRINMVQDIILCRQVYDEQSMPKQMLRLQGHHIQDNLSICTID